ncbi:hypothetical protein NEMIN01_0725 [Nematocida minor]|uniref:uncharacterized protein n=1 Tax=Nematocida minor TaxID=1912983 RepID=UPI0022208458|nr:uncharacterized protein NEMIN01_0725 [Nematocida minor]KAI5189862.1 hypothetical protein NEMIN01_0725 [Nematocida minor]
MGEKEIRKIPDQNQLRRKIEMRYESPGKPKPEVQMQPIDKGIEIKKVLIKHYMSTMHTRRVHIDESNRVCGFCNTHETSLWRRIGDIIVCNACGLYYRIHGKIRSKTISRGRKTKASAEQEKDEESEDE